MSSLEKSMALDLLHNDAVNGRDFYKLHVEEPAFESLNRWHWDNVSALDISSGDDTIARHLERRGVKPESIVRLSSGLSRAIQLNNLATGFQPESIDVITANMTLHHMGNRYLKSTVSRLGELLKTGGQLLFVGPNPEVYSEVPRSHFRLRQQMHMRLWDRFNPGYVDTIRDAAPGLGLSYVHIPPLMAPKYNSDPNVEVSYWPYGTPSMRVAGLLVKVASAPDDQPGLAQPLLEAGPELVFKVPPFQKLLEA